MCETSPSDILDQVDYRSSRPTNSEESSSASLSGKKRLTQTELRQAGWVMNALVLDRRVTKLRVGKILKPPVSEAGIQILWLGESDKRRKYELCRADQIEIYRRPT